MSAQTAPLPQHALLVTGPDDILLAKTALAHCTGAVLLVLTNPPGWGAAWWRALTSGLDPQLLPVFDAAEDGGCALEALYAGCRHVGLDTSRLPANATVSLADIARQTGASLHPRPAALIPVPESNNIEWKARRLAEWLDAAAASGYAHDTNHQDSVAGSMPPSGTGPHPS
jgi:hypothetical protein